MANLLEVVKAHLTPELIQQSAQALGEQENGISKALGGLAPVILAGLADKANDGNAFGNIFNMLSKFDGGILDNLGGLLNSGNLAQNDPKDLAGNLVGTLFGNKVPGILNAVAAFSGVKSSSVSSLLGVAGPLVMGLLGKKIHTDGLNVSGLANLLLSQKDSFLAVLPTGVGALLGLTGGGGARGGETVTAAAQGSGLKWLWPLLGLLALGLSFMYLARTCKQPTQPVVETPTVPKVDSAAIKAAEAAKRYARTLASGFEIKGNRDGIESKLIAFIEDASKPVDKTTWFSFDRLTFKTGSAEIEMDKSKEQLTNIYEIMKAFPKVKLKVGGYTDNVGNEAANLKLSLARARATVAALETMGVEKGRLSPEGYGSQHPVASNDTEEGRAQNRRIDVRVTAK